MSGHSSETTSEMTNSYYRSRIHVAGFSCLILEYEVQYRYLRLKSQYKSRSHDESCDAIVEVRVWRHSRIQAPYCR